MTIYFYFPLIIVSLPYMSKHQRSKSNSVVYTKIIYSFPKAKRFLPRLKTTYDLSYDLPVLKSNRAPSFGIGKKLESVMQSDVPPPGSYPQYSDFDVAHAHKGCSFGYGRDETVGGPINNSRHSRQVPGPGTYCLSDTLETPAITLKSKLPDLSLRLKQFVPGPGSYDTPALINASGRYVSSIHVNSRASRFSLPKSPTSNNHQRLCPGPGQYRLQTINKQGRYSNSKYQNSRVRSFGKSHRSDMSLRHARDIPGPGTYEPVSQFDTIL